jgi:replicative DNA helicase
MSASTTTLKANGSEPGGFAPLPADELTVIPPDCEVECGLIAALAGDPALFRELSPRLPLAAFPAEHQAWAQLSTAMRDGLPFAVPDGWQPVVDPQAAADRLLALAQWRVAVKAGRDLARMADRAGKETPQVALERIERAARDMRKCAPAATTRYAPSTAAEIAPALLAKVQEWIATAPSMGLPTGLSGLDRATGGLPTGLTMLAGGPGGGKTSFAWQVCQHVARQPGHCALYVSFENATESLALKGAASIAGLDTRLIRSGELDRDQRQRFSAALAAWVERSERLSILPGHTSLTVEQIRDYAEELKRQCGARKMLVVVDYLQQMAKTCDQFRDLGTVRDRVEVLGPRLRAEIASTLDCSVLAISSTRRGEPKNSNTTGYENPQIDNLKESGDLEFQADLILLLGEYHKGQRSHDMPPNKGVDVLVGKNREGEANTIVELVFRKDVAQFVERARR